MNYRRVTLREWWWFEMCNLIYTEDYMVEVWMPKNGFRWVW
jgi:hypothetical protein